MVNWTKVFMWTWIVAAAFQLGVSLIDFDTIRFLLCAQVLIALGLAAVNMREI